MDNIKVRVLSRVKRDGKYVPAGAEIDMPRKEYEARKIQEAGDSMLTPLYVPVEQYRQEQAQQAEEKAKKEGLGNDRHARIKADMQEASRIAQEALAIRAHKEAEQTRLAAEAAQARVDTTKARTKRPTLAQG